MRKQIVTLALAGSPGLTGAALLSPALASAQTPSPSTASGLSDRVAAIRDALEGLVSDDTITQAQADRVASTLAETLPRGGRGHHGPRGARVTPEATAAVLGITVDELRTRLQAGTTLAQVAEAEGLSRTALVDGLVTAAKAQLAADVEAGRLTQAQSDEAAATLTERVTDRIDRVGHGPGGRGHHSRDDDGDARDGSDDGAEGTPAAPGSTASATPSVGA